MKKLVSLILLVFLLAITGCSQSTTSEQKNDYPNKPIRMIVPYAAGGPTDMTARFIAAALNEHLPNGQSVVVENKPGGAATIGITEVFNSDPDGYTIAMTTSGASSFQPNFGKTVYTHDSFQPVAQVLSQPHYLVVKADSPWKTFDEWLEYVKKNPNKFTYSTAGTGNTGHLIMEALNDKAEIKTKHVPFEGNGPAITALLGGFVMGTNVQISDIKSYIESGEVRVLANTGRSKNKGFEDIPFFTESDIDVDISVYTGIIAPKGIPQEVLETLTTAIQKSIEDPKTQEKFNSLSTELDFAGPDEFQKTITEDYEMSGEILKLAGLIK